MDGLPAPPAVTSLRYPPAWAREFVGLPWRERGRSPDGVDCWGLVRLVFASRWRIRLPDWSDGYADTRDREALRAVVLAERAEWQRVSGPHFREGDVAVLRLAGMPVHVGVIVGWPWMLHIERGTDAICDRLDSPVWLRRLDGVWRHPEMLGS